MQFIVDHELFNKMIAEAASVVSSKSAIPILNGIKLIAEENRLIIVGSNSEVVLVKEIPLLVNGRKVLDVKEIGETVLSAKYLSPLLRKLSTDIAVDVKDGIAHIRSGEIRTRLSSMDSSEYPSLPQISENEGVSIGSEVFNQVVGQTVFAASSNESRPLLTGVNFSFSRGKLTAVATNSHRLTLKKAEIKSIDNGECTVPATSLITFSKLIRKTSSEVKLYMNENFIIFSSENTTLYSRLIEGQYPDVKRLIPNDSKLTIELNTKRLYEAVDRACLFASDWRHNNIRLSLNDSGNLSISSRAGEVGDISETQEIINFSGEAELDLSLDGSFLKDALSVIDNREILISFGGTMRPIIITPKSDSSYLQLISPVRSY
ncbi:DNA polymerase III subunit beta [Halobacillus rhizosphaerae]|uniref:DNA polymerase III subunit beta n=1 Tax=Halobacillus rhizosphaerae TaxID=3064889 RepID=UPI00398ABB26